MIRALHREMIIITYSIKSQTLLITEDEVKGKIRIKNPKTEVLEFDVGTKGDVRDITIDPAVKWLAVTF